MVNRVESLARLMDIHGIEEVSYRHPKAFELLAAALVNMLVDGLAHVTQLADHVLLVGPWSLTDVLAAVKLDVGGTQLRIKSESG